MMSRWLNELKKSQVLVMTYCVFLHAIHLNLLKINQCNLLIFDECHCVMSDDALKDILALYKSSTNSLSPRVLGLTAAIVNNKCKPLELYHLIKLLESKLSSVIQTSNNILSALQ